MGISQVAVFLDRDGVVNRAIVRNGKPYPPANVQQMEIMPDAFTALPLLKQAGFRLVVVTNQPDVARGKQTKKEVEQMHQALQSALPIDDFYVCYHDDADGCACRKPKPGLLIQAAAEHGLRLSDSYLIGDRWRDVEAGRAAGVRTVFLDFGYQEQKPKQAPDATVSSLSEAAEWILKRGSRSEATARSEH